eukprot:TRINITY_DN1828_c0_g1_i1.p1 TRINITY_DN1828_c0_g1~~TRINITY_DN1828_c0_g1_i1.p1  ORF type:complete len:539 (+),score=195.31 TRINITY_DN1828_c0_g1_i1:49-1665(+)
MRRVAGSVLLMAAVACAGPVVDIPGLGSASGNTAQLGGFSVDEFLGLQYATSKRWQSPVIGGAWSGTKQATDFGHSCPGSLCMRDGVEYSSEDCLFVNVYTPSKRNATLLPVMFFIHGGAYAYGCSQQYAGGSLVARAQGEVVVVTFNYRINAFGFLGHDGLRGSDNSTGNWGLQDQRTALQWVQKHISAFGGDPNQVTVFGQSAGAASISCHLVAPRSKPYLRRVIAESGLGTTWCANSLSRAETSYNALVKGAGCSDLACLQGKTATEIVTAIAAISTGYSMAHSLPWAPVIDGVEMTQQPWQYFQDGNTVQGIDILSGSSRDEASLFMLGLPTWNVYSYDSMIATLVKNPLSGSVQQAQAVYAQGGSYPYPTDLGTFSYWWWATMRSITDAVFQCTNRRSLRWLNAKNTNMYTYMMMHSTQTHTSIWGDEPGSVVIPHCEELPYVFNCPGYPNATSCTWPSNQTDEADLAQTISGYWINFARFGSPGGEWSQKFTPSADNYYMLDTRKEYSGGGLRFETDVRSDACDFWDQNLFP